MLCAAVFLLTLATILAEETGLSNSTAESHLSGWMNEPHHGDVIAGMQIPGPLEHHMSSVDDFWKMFKQSHNKSYSMRATEARRKQQWLANLIRIYQHNMEARAGLHPYYLRANHLSDLLNWVDKGFVTPVWDQKSCGSCYAFSIAASLAGQNFRKTREVVNLSVQQLVDCSVLSGNLGCQGGSLKNTLKYCVLAHGLQDDAHYPYSAKQRACRFHPRERKVNVTSFAILPSNDEVALQIAVALTGPVACSVNASPYTFQLYHKGIYDDPVCSPHHINHAMLIVGYTKDAWILKNWWGSHWGMDGYMLLRKGKNRCAVATLAAHPVLQGDESLLKD